MNTWRKWEKPTANYIMAQFKDIIVTNEFLDENPDIYFVFGDNTVRTGYGGAAVFRDHPRAYGFITKIFPDNRDSSFFTVDDYEDVFFGELERLKEFVYSHPNNKIYISQIGGGLANKYKIWENMIKPNIEKEFMEFDNVVFLWKK
jgi:hypothetical protein